MNSIVWLVLIEVTRKVNAKNSSIMAAVMINDRRLHDVVADDRRAGTQMCMHVVGSTMTTTFNLSGWIKQNADSSKVMQNCDFVHVYRGLFFRLIAS